MAEWQRPSRINPIGSGRRFKLIFCCLCPCIQCVQGLAGIGIGHLAGNFRFGAFYPLKNRPCALALGLKLWAKQQCDVGLIGFSSRMRLNRLAVCYSIALSANVTHFQCVRLGVVTMTNQILKKWVFSRAVVPAETISINHRNFTEDCVVFKDDK